MPFAENTTVTPERSQQEIAALVRKYGAQSFGTGWDASRAMVSFVAHGRQVRFILDLPSDTKEFRVTPSGRARKEPEARSAMEAEIRRRWRALALCLKAKLEAVSTGISSFEAEFLSHTVLPNGRTVADEALPFIEKAIASGAMPARPLLAIEA